MSTNGAANGLRDPVPFACEWRPEGHAAASVLVRGEVDIATAPSLAGVLADALETARLVVLDMRQASFVAAAGLHVMLDGSQRALDTGGRLLVITQSAQLEMLLDVTETRAALTVLALPPSQRDTAAEAGDRRFSAEDDRIRPLDNPVNAAVLTARAIAVPDHMLWLEGESGVLLRAWMPHGIETSALSGKPIQVYLDEQGDVNGWREPASGVAINQRRLSAGMSPPHGAKLACQGPCGIVWRAPAPFELTKHDERCLTCAGDLALL